MTHAKNSEAALKWLERLSAQTLLCEDAHSPELAKLGQQRDALRARLGRATDPPLDSHSATPPEPSHDAHAAFEDETDDDEDDDDEAEVASTCAHPSSERSLACPRPSDTAQDKVQQEPAHAAPRDRDDEGWTIVPRKP